MGPTTVDENTKGKGCGERDCLVTNSKQQKAKITIQMDSV